MIERVRPTPTGAELAELYAYPNDADNWREHRLRVDLTVTLARSAFPNARTLIDPAAGSGRTAAELGAGLREVITGDLAGGQVTHPGLDALACLDMYAGRRFDLVVLGEILEHVDAPLELLIAARRCVSELPGGGLIVSTPLDEPAGINPEHVWRWDRAGVLELLAAAEFVPLDYVELDTCVPGWPHPCRTQIHTASASA